MLAGKILADLGADVIQIEPPGGSSARNVGPFYGDDPHPDKSLFWWAYSANKRSITLDLEQRDGQALLEKLVAEADFLIESFPPGYLEKLSLDYEHLTNINPRLVMRSEEHTSELQSLVNLVCRLLLEKKKKQQH